MPPGILLIGDYPPPHGGVAVHVKQLHRFLSDQGFKTRVLDIGKGQGRARDSVIPVKTLWQYGATLASYAVRGWLLHLHTSGNNLKSWAVVASVSGALGRGGKIVTLHSGLLPAFLRASPVHRAAARAALWGMDQIVAVSGAVRDALMELGVDAAKVTVLPAFLASAVRPGALPSAYVKRGAPLLSMAHHPSPVYGREEMLRAMPAIRDAYPDAVLAVFGPGAVPDAEFVIRLGELPHDQVLALMRESDVFVRPTQADGDAISVREALAMGVPTVASDVAVRPEGAITYRAGDANALARSVIDAVKGGRRAVYSVDAGPALLSLYQQRFQEAGYAADGGR
ncbi:MAG: glycosyltransferase family 4 protein [Myxococcaceae bacterium]